MTGIDRIPGPDGEGDSARAAGGLRSRLERLPPGHPSSPYEADGSARQAIPRLHDLELLVDDKDPDVPGSTLPDARETHAGPEASGETTNDDSEADPGPSRDDGLARADSRAGTREDGPPLSGRPHVSSRDAPAADAGPEVGAARGDRAAATRPDKLALEGSTGPPGVGPVPAARDLPGSTTSAGAGRPGDRPARPSHPESGTVPPDDGGDVPQDRPVEIADQRAAGFSAEHAASDQRADAPARSPAAGTWQDLLPGPFGPADPELAEILHPPASPVPDGLLGSRPGREAAAGRDGMAAAPDRAGAADDQGEPDQGEAAAETGPRHAYEDGVEITVTGDPDDGIWVGGLPGEMPGRPYGDPYGTAEVGDVLAGTDTGETRSEKLMAKFLERGDDIIDITRDRIDDAWQIFGPRPTYTEMPAREHHATVSTPYHEIDAGTAATAIMALGVAAWGIRELWHRAREKEPDQEGKPR